MILLREHLHKAIGYMLWNLLGIEVRWGFIVVPQLTNQVSLALDEDCQIADMI